MGARRNSISILPKITSCLKKTSSSTSKCKVLLDDFEDVAMEKVRASYKSDEMVIEVFFGSCFFFWSLDYPGGQILDLRLPRSTRMSYKEMTDLLLDKTKDNISKWFYCKPKYVEVICESDEEVASKYKSHEKVKKDLSYVVRRAYCMGARRNLISILPKITSCLEKKTSASTSKGKVVLDDFEDVANGKGRVVSDDFANVGNGKGMVVLDESKDGIV
uniref:Uncharacterized protein n=1 Tax=Tanacetum cinerariifolium TaxID=118510 RepID=A0A6L2JEL2_TANCI|nr:hypothetical protein [Tanacetum cinerariifolium]